MQTFIIDFVFLICPPLISILLNLVMPMLFSVAVFYMIIPTGLSETLLVFLSIIVTYSFFSTEEFIYTTVPALKNYYIAGRIFVMLICWIIVILISLNINIKDGKPEFKINAKEKNEGL